MLAKYGFHSGCGGKRKPSASLKLLKHDECVCLLHLDVLFSNKSGRFPMLFLFEKKDIVEVIRDEVLELAHHLIDQLVDLRQCVDQAIGDTARHPSYPQYY